MEALLARVCDEHFGSSVVTPADVGQLVLDHRALQARLERVEGALAECIAALTAPTIGTYDMDDPAWYRAVDVAVKRARTALQQESGTDG